MDAQEMRETYINFFKERDHAQISSAPLVPENDPTVLFTTAGMHPLVPYLLGEKHPAGRRLTDFQKCVRTGDIDEVGDASHLTFFEMLGNWSLGDYFKTESVGWSYELLTKVLKIDPNHLAVTCFEGEGDIPRDDETAQLWKSHGLRDDQIFFYGREDNWWGPAGQTGPCGPDTEIFYDDGRPKCGPDCGPSCHCGKYTEIWNNVFSQFNNMGDGTYTELKQKNIDTGMGLERLACVMQDVDNMFEVDSIRKVLDSVCAVAGKSYGKDAATDISIRVVTDHIRSAMFMISDGVIPSNEGRGYVLRRILRRACRHGKLLGINHSFLPELCKVAIGESDRAYPELDEKRDYILKVIAMEEERFDATIDAGLSILSGMIEDAKKAGKTQLSGEDVFKLYDTFGFPIDLTREIAEEAGLTLDDARFDELMKAQKVRAREARANISGWSNATGGLIKGLDKTVFTGYEKLTDEGRVLAILADGMNADEISEGECSVVLDRTPFYGEGGGQVGDTGTLTVGKTVLNVTDTKKSDGVYIHLCTVADGILKKGDTVTAAVDAHRRMAIMRNHSACHLLQSALRRVLGNHVEQAGSYVSDTICRFDFTHFAALTAEELARVEELVNADIFAAQPGSMTEMPIDEAKKLGAMALFGEKYGKTVRVVRMGEHSVEFCGGTHLDNTAKIGMFKIVSEASVAAGVRRIEAVTGEGILALLAEKNALLNDAAKALKAQKVADVPARAAQVLGELSAAKKEIDGLNAKLAGSRTEDLLAKATKVGAVRLVTADLGEIAPDALRSLGDEIKARQEDVVAVLAMRKADGVQLLAVAGKAAVAAGAHAGKLVGAIAAVVGGKGGGRPDSAMAGGKEIAKTAEALATAGDVLAGMLK